MQAIAINSRFMQRRLTGVERYSNEIIRRLDSYVRLVTPGAGYQGWRGHLWEQIILPTQLGQGELLWSIANSGPIALERQVLSLYDLSVLDHPEWYARSFAFWYRCMLPTLVRRVRALFTASSYVKIRISRANWIADQLVKIIPGGVDHAHFYPRERREIVRLAKKFHLPDRYFLSVGSIQPRKNLRRLMDAFERLTGVDQGVGLVIVGERGKNFRPVPFPASKGKQQFIGYIPDCDLPGLYSGALAFVMPSLDEGFGLPVLESMACGTPVIASRAGALPEVTGEAAILVNPYSTDEIARALTLLEHDGDLRQEMSQRGLERSQVFDWDRSARMAREALHDAVHSKVTS